MQLTTTEIPIIFVAHPIRRYNIMTECSNRVIPASALSGDASCRQHVRGCSFTLHTPPMSITSSRVKPTMPKSEIDQIIAQRTVNDKGTTLSNEFILIIFEYSSLIECQCYHIRNHNSNQGVPRRAIHDIRGV
jgi:hypothetical protein